MSLLLCGGAFRAAGELNGLMNAPPYFLISGLISRLHYIFDSVIFSLPSILGRRYRPVPALPPVIRRHRESWVFICIGASIIFHDSFIIMILRHIHYLSHKIKCLGYDFEIGRRFWLHNDIRLISIFIDNYASILYFHHYRGTFLFAWYAWLIRLTMLNTTG